MKLFLKILFILLTWFTNLANATPVFTKVVLPNYELSFLKTENVKEESEVKIGIQNFARSGISEKPDTLNATSRENYVLEESRARMRGEVGKGAGSLFRGVSKSEFIGTVGDFANGVYAQIADQAWDLWKQQKWSDLENLFNANKINKYNNVVLPPNNGAINIIKKTLDPSDFNGNLIIDRYGATTGKFTAPANTPFGQRALPSSYAGQTPQKYKVLKPIPNVEEGQIIPWFNQPGLGIQYKLEKSVQYYIDEGFLQIIP